MLFELKELQLLAHDWQIDDIHLEEKFAVFRYRHTRRIRELGFLVGDRLRIVDQLHAYYLLDYPSATAEETLAVLKSLLRQNAS